MSFFTHYVVQGNKETLSEVKKKKKKTAANFFIQPFIKNVAIALIINNTDSFIWLLLLSVICIKKYAYKHTISSIAYLNETEGK